MRKIKILPVMALSLMTLGSLATVTSASAATHHQSVFSEDDDGDNADFDDDFVVEQTSDSGSGVSASESASSGATPSGAAFTGAGGTAAQDAGSGFAGRIRHCRAHVVGAVSRRRRAVKA